MDKYTKEQTFHIGSRDSNLSEDTPLNETFLENIKKLVVFPKCCDSKERRRFDFLLQQQIKLECLELNFNEIELSLLDFYNPLLEGLRQIESLNWFKVTMNKNKSANKILVDIYELLAATRWNLKGLYLSMEGITDFICDAEKIVKQVSNQLIYLELNIQSSYLPQDHLEKLYNCILKCWQLKHFSLNASKSGIGTSGVKKVLRALRKCTEIEEIDLDFSFDATVIEVDTTGICGIFKHSERLRVFSIKFKDQSLSFEDVNKLAISASNHPSLQTINFEFLDRMESKAFVILYSLLKNNNRISLQNMSTISNTIDLSFISEDGVNISLGSNCIKEYQIDFLSQTLSKIQSLNSFTLHLPQNFISNKCIRQISDSISCNPLQLNYFSFDFSESILGLLALDKLFSFVKMCTNLHHFTFISTKSHLYLSEIQPLLLAIPYLLQLESLSLQLTRNPELNPSQFIPLSRSFKNFSQLKLLTLLLSVPFKALLLDQYQASLSTIKKNVYKLPRLIEFNYN